LAALRENFNSAKIIPIILKDKTNEDEIINLNEALIEVCRDECLMVSSIDFSHYLPGALAEIHDNLSLRVLNNLDKDLVKRTEIDSIPAISLLVEFVKNNQAQEFVLSKHLNSGQIEYSPDGESTSYVLGYFQKGTPQLKDSFSFMIGGDVMLGRQVDYTFKNNLNLLWSNISDRFFNGVDLSLVNLEGPISQTPTNPDKNDQSLVFNLPPESASFLKNIKINAVSLANNHVFNQGWSGFENTRDVLNKNNIAPIGVQSGIEAQSIKRFQAGKQKVSVITLNLTNSEVDLATQIKAEKARNSRVIIYAHWGNEYEKTHSEAQSKYAHAWIDAGADLVVGTHPHVVQDAEIYKNRPIFYSLGNLIFDQQFSEEVKDGLVIAGFFEEDNLKIALVPVYNNNLKPEISTGSRKFNIIYKIKNPMNMYTNWSYGYDIIDFELK
jgi:poly-gamma-glutamate synthesis protein (capsule biosynthesis protein)